MFGRKRTEALTRIADALERIADAEHVRMDTEEDLSRELLVLLRALMERDGQDELRAVPRLVPFPPQGMA